MSTAARTMMRDCSAAIAVLALYVLTLLIPLHQAQASQDTFETLGFEPLSGWSLCVAGEWDRTDPDSPQPVCPVAGVGKLAVIEPDFGTLPPAPVVLTDPVAIPQIGAPCPARPLGEHPARAPPDLA